MIISPVKWSNDKEVPPNNKLLEVTSASGDEMSAGNCLVGSTCKIQGTCALDDESSPVVLVDCKLLLLFRR